MMKEFRACQKRVDFNEANIRAMFEALVLENYEMVSRSIISAGRLLDIELLDPIVIGKQRFVSMKERGLAF